jgi:ubiquinone/menaquinone biosynthesis C-methylase UbiE
MNGPIGSCIAATPAILISRAPCGSDSNAAQIAFSTLPTELGLGIADIGAGDGLIAFRAIERVGPSLQVLFTDISRPLLRPVEAAANRLGVRGQCSFHHCNAETLVAIGDASVDVVTTRAGKLGKTESVRARGAIAEFW